MLHKANAAACSITHTYSKPQVSADSPQQTTLRTSCEAPHILPQRFYRQRSLFSLPPIYACIASPQNVVYGVAQWELGSSCSCLQIGKETSLRTPCEAPHVHPRSWPRQRTFASSLQICIHMLHKANAAACSITHTYSKPQLSADSPQQTALRTSCEAPHILPQRFHRQRSLFSLPPMFACIGSAQNVVRCCTVGACLKPLVSTNRQRDQSTHSL